MKCFLYVDYQKAHKGIVTYFHTLVAILFVPKNAHGIEYFPFYLAIIYNVILDCLQNRKYCEAIMDDLLLLSLWKMG